MNSDFKFYSLKELVNIKYGKDKKNVEDLNGKYPILGTGGIIGYANTFLYNKPSVLIGRKGTIDKVKYIEEPFWTVDTLFYTEINEDIVFPKFLYYLLSQIDFSIYNEGTSIPSLRTDTLNRLEFPIPDLNYQKNILNILNPIDFKIEINKKINHNLDLILDNIFKKMFIDKCSENRIPDNWSMKKIGDLPLIITDYVANGSFASLKKNVTIFDHEDYAYFIRNTDLKTNSFERFVDEHSYNFLKKSSLFGNEVIISNVGDVGSIFLCPFLDKPMTLGNNMILVKSELNNVNLNYYIYLLFKSSFGQYLLNSITSGSVQLKFNKTDFKSLKLTFPPYEYIDRFNNLTQPIFKEKNILTAEINKLTNLRDTLLPKLMSGEIDVSKIEV